MQERYKDTDLREALRRKYAEMPQLPADFMMRMQKRMEQGNHEDSPHDAERVQSKVRAMRRWAWMAAAASLLFLIGVGVTLWPTDRQTDPEARIAQHTEKVPQAEQPAVSHQQSESLLATDSQPVRDVQKVSGLQRNTNPTTAHQPEVTTEEASSALDIDPSLHYASDEATTDTVPYQDPARVDEFITKFANYYKVKEGELKCSAVQDSNVVSTVYVFPDTKEVDVFNRLLQAACWYSSETPGYFLNFSHQQFFFELKDMRHQLHYRWIAERVNGKILLYGTHAPLGTKESSTCYQEYRDELMHIKSFNKTRKI